MQCIRILALAALGGALISCETTSNARVTQALNNVKTTAYTHTEADHLKYSVSSAVGTPLKYGMVRSAAADWSVYPVGTVFQIEGEPYIYQIDDYGSALVGTNTIDLYKPSKQAMAEWGARKVNIKVIKWGSSSQSLAIMKDRERRSQAVHQMVKRLETSN